MQKPNQDIERIIKSGFTRLPVSDASASRAINEIEQRKNVVKQDDLLFPFVSKPKWPYALAALFLFFCGMVFWFQNHYPSSEGLQVTNKEMLQDKLNNNVSILSEFRDSNTKLKQNKYPENEFLTNKRSQILLTMGLRTRTILFEQSQIRVKRADSLRTIIVLRHGAIAVDIALQKKKDTVSVITAFGSFTQIGTRFSLSVDSIRGVQLEVYSGKVLVHDENGMNILIAAGQAWESGNKESIHAIHRSTMEMETMQKIFSSNKIEHFFNWGSYWPPHSVTVSEPILSKRSRSAAFQTDRGIVQIIGKMLLHDDFSALDSIISLLHDRSIADSVFKTIQVMTERKISLFQFQKAQRLLEIISDRAAFTARQREDAMVRLYMLHKDHLNASREALLKMIRNYRERFPEGAFGDDMTAEAIALLLGISRYNDAAIEMKQLLARYPRSPHCEYYRYVYASTLRENLHRPTDALAEYEKYVASNSNGKFKEDALYWIIELGRSLGELSTVSQYKKIYLQLYPQGRWIEEIRTIDVLERSSTSAER
jgi:hypothetical protein